MLSDEQEKFLKTITPESTAIANQARREQRETGHVTVTCPKCHEHPKVEITPGGERITICCPCGYVKLAEIIF